MDQGEQQPEWGGQDVCASGQVSLMVLTGPTTTKCDLPGQRGQRCGASKEGLTSARGKSSQQGEMEQEERAIRPLTDYPAGADRPWAGR